MQILKVLRLPVPPHGRVLTEPERRSIKARSGVWLPVGLTWAVWADEVGAVCMVYGLPRVDFLLVEVDAAPVVVIDRVPCLAGPVPDCGRFMTGAEAAHARVVGLLCSVRTYIKPRPSDGLAARWDRVSGHDELVSLLPYVPRPAGRPSEVARLVSMDADGCRRVACLDGPVPAEGRDLTYQEEQKLRRLAPDIKYSSYYIIPVPGGALLPYVGYTGLYLLVEPATHAARIVVGSGGGGIEARRGRSKGGN